MEPREEVNGSFAYALGALNSNAKVARAGWNGRGMYIEKQTPTETSKMTRPYIFMKTADDQLVPWVASQTDLLAEDWYIVADINPDDIPR